ncbi:MAG: metal ABC transporter permease [Oligoflexia bacterium]|nr:metal ABC transporter permease [Oligoflexia bacterium]
MSEKLALFAASWELWRGAVAAGVVAGAVCGFVGIYVVLHRIVFVSAAMSQVSSLGVMLAFWLVQAQAIETAHHSEDILPLLFAALFTGVFSAAMAGHASARLSDRTKSSEAFIGSVYLLSSAALVLVGDQVTRGAHDVANILFGNTVIVDLPHLLLFAGVSLPIAVLHVWLRKDLLFVSFDPVMATTLGYPVTWLRVLLLVSLGMVISIGTRTIGALPVFSFSVLPPIAALALFENLRSSFWASAVIGALSAFLGYVTSFLLGLPTGASMAATAGVFLLVAKGLQRLRD